MRCEAILAAGLALGCTSVGDGTNNGELVQDPRGTLELVLNDPTTHKTPGDRCDDPVCLKLVALIDKAEKTIDFALYGMRNQTRVLEAIRAAKERGVLVRGVVDRDLDGKNYYSSTEDLVAVVGKIHSDLEADRKLAAKERRSGGGSTKCQAPEGFPGPLQCLAYDLGDKCLLAAHASREATIDSAAIMHNKYFVIDSRFLWTGSTNLSDSGTGGYNANLVAVLDSRKVSNWYIAEFEQMYTKNRYHKLKDSHGDLRASLSNADVHVLFSPQDDAMRNAVRPILKGAKKRIDIAIFFLTNKHITEDLIAAHLRGVKVRVIMDATAAKNGYTKHELLRAAGIPVKVENWGGKMHMKSAVIDDETVIAGSMNWTSAGDFANDENTIIISSPEHARQYGLFFATLWASIPDKWLQANPDPESIFSSTSCTDGVDNDFDDLADDEDPGCSDTPPPLPELPPWKIIPRGDRITCEVGMDR